MNILITSTILSGFNIKCNEDRLWLCYVRGWVGLLGLVFLHCRERYQDTWNFTSWSCFKTSLIIESLLYTQLNELTLWPITLKLTRDTYTCKYIQTKEKDNIVIKGIVYENRRSRRLTASDFAPSLSKVCESPRQVKLWHSARFRPPALFVRYLSRIFCLRLFLQVGRRGL